MELFLSSIETYGLTLLPKSMSQNPQSRLSLRKYYFLGFVAGTLGGLELGEPVLGLGG